MMRMILLAGAVLALSGCGGGNGSSDSAANDANAVTADNLMMDQNLSVDSSGNVTANGAMDSNTENMMEKDRNTHDPDTNLANGI
jgi:uncharacterized protein YceK